MQEVLEEKKAALISERFHDNALLQVCQQIWPERQEEIESVIARAEDIFCEAAWLMDELIDADEDRDAMSLIRELWSKVVVHVGQWNNNVSLPDRYLIVSTIFRLVATSFSLHWHSHYCDSLRDAIISIISEKRPSPHDLHEQQQQERQQQALIDALIPCSHILNDWINYYIDAPNCWLSDEIDSVLHPMNIVPKTEENKRGKTFISRTRKVWKDETIKHSFDYHPKSMPAEERNKRLSLFYNLLNRSFVTHTKQETFINIFSGVSTNEYIVWKGYIVELQYMINTLVKEKLITWNRPAPGKWQIVCARFRLERNVILADETTEIKKTSKVIEPIEPKQFNKIPKENKLTEHAVLDKIISILKEESDSEKITREIMVEFSHMERNEENDKSYQNQVKNVDY